jgi:hypothetical protein
MAEQPDTLVPPVPPGDWDCCGSGCENCVWTLYQARLDAYNRAQAARSQRGSSDDPADGKSEHDPD